MIFWTAAPMTAEEPRKGEPSSAFYAARATAPTRAFSARQLPTDHDYAVPTREYQSDQSSRLLPPLSSAYCPSPNNQNTSAQSSPAGTLESPCQNKGRLSSRWWESRPNSKHRQTRTGLTRSLHI